jgi:membrane-associated phospholipid phosphatase
MMKRIGLLLLLFGSVFPTLGQRINPLNGDYFKSYYTGCRNLIVSPIHWDNEQWVTFTVTGLSIVGLMSFDEPINLNENGLTNLNVSILSSTRHWGSGLYSLPAFGLLYGYGWAQGIPKFQYAALDASKAFILSRVLVQIPKFLFQRVRPNTMDYNSFTFFGPLGNGMNRSFPSGHTTSIFASASVLSYYFEERSSKIIFYSLASLVGLQRIASGEHWFSDVVAGAAFGAYCGRFLVTHKPKQGNLSIYPYFGASSIGALVKF